MSVLLVLDIQRHIAGIFESKFYAFDLANTTSYNIDYISEYLTAIGTKNCHS